MHATPRHRVRSGWLWSLLALVAALGLTVWLVRLQQTACAGTFAGSGARSGHAGSYTASGHVACSYRTLPAGDRYAAVAPAEYDQGAACGTYLDIAGPRDHVVVEVVDRCGSCGPGRLGLGRGAFARIADPSRGVVPIRYTQVRDPATSGTLSYEVKDGSSPGWLGLLVSGNGDPLQKVEVRFAKGSWRRLSRGPDNYWTGSGAGSGPFAARVADALGHQAETADLAFRPGWTQHTHTRLYPAGSPTSPPEITLSTAPHPSAGNGSGLEVTGCSHDAVRRGGGPLP